VSAAGCMSLHSPHGTLVGDEAVILELVNIGKKKVLEFSSDMQPID
jgi:hypothetical protein